MTLLVAYVVGYAAVDNPVLMEEWFVMSAVIDSWMRRMTSYLLFGVI